MAIVRLDYSSVRHLCRLWKSKTASSKKAQTSVLRHRLDDGGGVRHRGLRATNRCNR